MDGELNGDPEKDAASPPQQFLIQVPPTRLERRTPNVVRDGDSSSNFRSLIPNTSNTNNVTTQPPADNTPNTSTSQPTQGTHVIINTVESHTSRFSDLSSHFTEIKNDEGNLYQSS